MYILIKHSIRSSTNNAMGKLTMQEDVHLPESKPSGESNTYKVTLNESLVSEMSHTNSPLNSLTTVESSCKVYSIMYILIVDRYF